jgi:hypothetical protein
VVEWPYLFHILPHQSTAYGMRHSSGDSIGRELFVPHSGYEAGVYALRWVGHVRFGSGIGCAFSLPQLSGVGVLV